MVLGHGNFGRVVKAEAIGIVEHVDVLSVAVKMVKGRLSVKPLLLQLVSLSI